MSNIANNGAAPQVKVESITPQVASQYLGTSAGNRNLRRNAVNRYARDMVGGKWVLNGESIKFDRAGHLIDGHHRLSAIVEAKATIQILVIRGIQEGAMLTLDTGSGRSFHDAILVAGRGPAPVSLAPVLRWWYKYDLAQMASGGLTPSHQELQAILDRHPHCVESARLVGKLKILVSRCMPGVQGFVHAYASWKFDREMADQFMQELNAGTQLDAASPIYLLRHRLVDVPTKTRLDSSLVMALTIKAWNAWIDGRKIKTLQWRTEGDTPEPFPAFKGDEDRFARARERQLAKRMENLSKVTPEGRAKGVLTRKARAAGGVA